MNYQMVILSSHGYQPRYAEDRDGRHQTPSLSATPGRTIPPATFTTRRACASAIIHPARFLAIEPRGLGGTGRARREAREDGRVIPHGSTSIFGLSCCQPISSR